MDPRAEAVVQNLLGMLDRFAPYGEQLDEADVRTRLADVRHPMFNVVAGARFGIDARRRTARLAGRLIKRGLPFLWVVDPSPGSDEVADVLTGLGLASSPTVGMHRALTDVEVERPEYPRAQPVPAADPWMLDVSMAAFGLPEELRAPLQQRLPALDTDATHLLFVQRGEPVACGSGVGAGQTWGLYNIATFPGQTRRGLGALMVADLLRAGAEGGYRDAVLTAAPGAESLYLRAGFEPVVELGQFVWIP